MYMQIGSECKVVDSCLSVPTMFIAKAAHLCVKLNTLKSSVLLGFFVLHECTHAYAYSVAMCSDRIQW